MAGSAETSNIAALPALARRQKVVGFFKGEGRIFLHKFPHRPKALIVELCDFLMDSIRPHMIGTLAYDRFDDAVIKFDCVRSRSSRKSPVTQP
ncbi:hypothetical protein [Mesorhizobium carmichaelinearum]|uniref:hypothetical protein n=1 Tax=Mesorhizobium carmichaelinearum TaxID=1208188 RepID=UPI000BA47AB5|nr:hypothetical protein [Mesorhizobium carmichaelinearum]